MTTRFKNAIDALVYAFFNDTLAKGTCTACAVGNICAHAMGATVVADGTYNAMREGRIVENHHWRYLFFTDGLGVQHFGKATGNSLYGLAMIARTGYSLMELARVEKAFETNTKINWMTYYRSSKEAIMQDQYNGLMAVVDVLCEIEGIEDPSEYKELFTIQ
jgi:hypothetical protein